MAIPYKENIRVLDLISQVITDARVIVIFIIIAIYLKFVGFVAAYKKQRVADNYFKTDFSKTEQNIIKSAIYGRKGKFVWYISMSSKANNLKGEAALKKKL